MHDRQACVDTLRHRQTVSTHTPIAVRGLDEQARCLFGKSAVLCEEIGVADAAENFADFRFGLPLEYVFSFRVELFQ